MKLQRTVINETPNGQIIEMLYANAPLPDETSEQVVFRVQLQVEGYPRLPELQLVALRRVRTVIGDEIHRLQDQKSSNA